MRIAKVYDEYHKNLKWGIEYQNVDEDDDYVEVIECLWFENEQMRNEAFENAKREYATY